MKDIRCLDLTVDLTHQLKMPRSIDLTLDENELKFLINLMWSTDSHKTKSMAERLNIVDEALGRTIGEVSRVLCSTGRLIAKL